MADRRARCGSRSRGVLVGADRVPPPAPARARRWGSRRSGWCGARGLGRVARRICRRCCACSRSCALAVALARPETYRTVTHEIDSIDIMIVFDMSKSMEETDMPRDRMDAAQRVIRRFLRRTKTRSRRPRDLRPAGDAAVPADAGHEARSSRSCAISRSATCPSSAPRSATASRWRSRSCGGPTAVRLGERIRRARRTSTCSTKASAGQERNKVVILLSDGDTNWVTRFEPDEAARTAQRAWASRSTRCSSAARSRDLFGGMSVNPATLRSIAALTGGEFFRATDYESFDRGFQTVRNKLDTTKRERRASASPTSSCSCRSSLIAALLLGARPAAVAHAAAEVAVSVRHESRRDVELFWLAVRVAARACWRCCTSTTARGGGG